jgi:hypothetical protein
LRSAKIHFNNSVVDCIIVDQSPGGVRISTDVQMPFPKQVIVELRSGERWSAMLRWQQGLESGFQYETFAGLSEEFRQDALDLYDKVYRTGIFDVLQQLDRKGCFGNADLKAATKSADESLRGLISLLNTLSLNTLAGPS